MCEIAGAFHEFIEMKISVFWELLNCGKFARDHFLLETLQVKWLLSYNGNGKKNILNEENIFFES